MGTHTPGPWHFVPENTGLMFDHGYGILYGEPDSWGWEKNLYVSVGCSVRVARELGEDTAEANARLIAAAPDLLGALKDLLSDCEEYARINNLHNSDGSPATHHSMRRAADVIAKAEGSAQKPDMGTT